MKDEIIKVTVSAQLKLLMIKYIKLQKVVSIKKYYSGLVWSVDVEVEKFALDQLFHFGFNTAKYLYP